GRADRGAGEAAGRDARRGRGLGVVGPAGGFEEVLDLVAVVPETALACAGKGHAHPDMLPSASRAPRQWKMRKQAYATAADGRIESSRSRKPPWPGNQPEMSLMPSSRLMSDSMRSPIVPTNMSTSPMMVPSHHG